MYRAESKILTSNAEKYVDMLSHHFARKVTVDRDGSESKVHFPMGECHMNGVNDQLCFYCEADTEEALNTVKRVIDEHIYLLKKIRNEKLVWSSVII